MTDNTVIQVIIKAIKNQQSFTVSNSSMGGDPCPGSSKAATVWYYDEAHPTPIPVKSRSTQEGEALYFDIDVLNITYGPLTVTSPNFYFGIMAAIISGGTFPVNNTSLGGDPNFLIVKTCNVIYRQAGQLKEVSASEGNSLSFR